MAASFRLAMARPAGLARHLGWLLALLPLPLQAAGTPKLDPTLYPPPDTFRSLQLAVLACGRENTAALCEKARLQADPLLDHPRLPSVCKDVLWNIRQKSVVGRGERLQPSRSDRETGPRGQRDLQPDPEAKSGGRRFRPRWRLRPARGPAHRPAGPALRRLGLFRSGDPQREASGWGAERSNSCFEVASMKVRVMGVTTTALSERLQSGEPD